jgi:hypothetical protein
MSSGGFDMNELAMAFGGGMASGLTLNLMILGLILPVCYVMNRFIYHGAVMRTSLGAVALLGSVFSFAILLMKRMSGGEAAKAEYFGLLPMFEVGAEPAAPSGWFASLFRILNVLRHPLLYVADNAKYESTVKHMLLDPSKIGAAKTFAESGLTVKPGVVNEEVFRMARGIAEATDKVTWQAACQSLSPAAKYQYLGGTLLKAAVPAQKKATMVDMPAAAEAPMVEEKTTERVEIAAQTEAP